MKCPIDSRETEILVAYCSGSLAAERSPLLASHLEDCAACRQFVKDQQAVWDALDGWQAAPVSADFNRRLYQRIEQPHSWFDRLALSLHWSGLRQAIPIAASAAVVLMAGLLLQHNFSAPPVAHHNSAVVEAIQPDDLENALSEMEALSQLSRPVRSDNAGSKM